MNSSDPILKGNEVGNEEDSGSEFEFESNEDENKEEGLDVEDFMDSRVEEILEDSFWHRIIKSIYGLNENG